MVVFLSGCGGAPRVCQVALGETWQGTQLEALAKEYDTPITKQAHVAISDFAKPFDDQNGTNAASLKGWNDLQTLCIDSDY